MEGQRRKVTRRSLTRACGCGILLPHLSTPQANQSGTNHRKPQEVPQVVEHLFRHESGKMVATLARIFGVEHLTLAEDVVQEALVRALQTWPYYGVPEN